VNTAQQGRAMLDGKEGVACTKSRPMGPLVVLSKRRTRWSSIPAPVFFCISILLHIERSARFNYSQVYWFNQTARHAATSSQYSGG
jgi:hypothetical protein